MWLEHGEEESRSESCGELRVEQIMSGPEGHCKDPDLYSNEVGATGEF